MSRGNQHQYDYISACSAAPTHPSRFSLALRQQPLQARISTNNERDRRPIDPPPIVQIKLANASASENLGFLQNMYFFMCANLAHPTNDDEVYTPNHNALSGQTVSSMYKLKDINNDDGGFFILGDLSVKVEGCFRLKLTLFEITLSGAVPLQSVFTSPFTVYSFKNFPGLLDSTFLSRSFSDQGARIRIKKEHRNQLSMPRKRKLSIDEQSAYQPRPSPPSTSQETYSTGSMNTCSSYHSVRQQPQKDSPTAARAALLTASRLSPESVDSHCSSSTTSSSSTNLTSISSSFGKHESYHPLSPTPVCRRLPPLTIHNDEIANSSPTTTTHLLPSPPWKSHELLPPPKFHPAPSAVDRGSASPPASPIQLPPLSRVVLQQQEDDTTHAAVAMMQLSQRPKFG